MAWAVFALGPSSFSSHLLLRRPLFCSFAPREQRRRPFAVTLLGTLSAPLCFSHSASSGRVLQVNNSHKAEHKWPIFFSSLKTRGLRNQGCWKAATQPSDSGVKRLWMRCGDSKTKATVSLRRERWRHGSQKTEAVKHHLRGLLLGFFSLFEPIKYPRALLPSPLSEQTEPRARLHFDPYWW